MNKGIIGALSALVIALVGLFTVNVGSASAAMVFHSGFEGGSTFEWSSATGTYSIQTGIKRTGAYAMRCNPSAGTGYVTSGITTGRRVTFYLYIATAPNATIRIAGSTTTGQANIRLNSTRYLLLYDGNTSRGTSTTQLALSTWYRVSADLGAGSAAWLAINGTKEVSGQTITTSPANFNFGVMTSATADLYFDDCAIDSASSTTDLGDIRVLTSVPDTAGSNSGFDYGTPATGSNRYQNVDEIPYSDTDYNAYQSNSGTGCDTYSIQDASTIGIGANDTINAVSTWYRMDRGGGSGGTHQSTVMDNGTNYHTTRTLSTSYAWFNRYDATMPNDGAAWTQARFNSFEIGANHSAAGSQNTNLSACYAMVAYTPASNIANAPASKNFGVVNVNSSYWSNGSAPTFPLGDSACYFAVTNNSTAPVNITISANNFTGGVGWTLISGSPVGLLNQVRMTAYKSGDGSGNGVILTNSGQSFISGLGATPPNNTKKWEIELETGTFNDGVQKSSTITLTASYS